MKTRRLLPAGVAFIVFASLASACNLPELDDYKALPLAQTSFLYASDGSLITELHATEDRVVLRKGDMPAYLRDAVVAIEDRRFYYHHGVDGRAIARAAYMNAAEGSVVEGGSTITQQLVKILYVGSADTLRRKIDEAALAWQLEDRMNKDRILTKYLNTVYFGEGAYGVEAAAQTYFSVDAADLTVSQAAILAGLITAPNHFDPFLEPESCLRPTERRPAPDARAGDGGRGRLPAGVARAHRAGSERADPALSLPLLRRLLQGMVPVQPGVRRDAPGPIQAAVHGRPPDHHHARPQAPGVRANGGALGPGLSG